jgi:hypothetical protein
MAGNAAPVMMRLEHIRLNGGTQLREYIDQDTVQDYAEILDELPPVIVFADGKNFWLADGFHRYKAAQFAGREEIACEIRNGSRRDAILFAAGANARHGLRRSRADKRKAVVTLLSDKEWWRWCDREIARQCAVSATWVAVLRREMQGGPKPGERRLAMQAGRIVSRPAEHQRPTVLANGNGNGHANANGNSLADMVRCPKCKHKFALSHAVAK